MPDEKHTGLPVSGYKPQSPENVALVNEFKADEERLLRKIDKMNVANQRDFAIVPGGANGALALHYDPKWMAVAKTHFQQGFMALNRAVFQPDRLTLPEDTAQLPLNDIDA